MYLVNRIFILIQLKLSTMKISKNGSIKQKKNASKSLNLKIAQLQNFKNSTCKLYNSLKLLNEHGARIFVQ